MLLLYIKLYDLNFKKYIFKLIYLFKKIFNFKKKGGIKNKNKN